MPHRDTERAVAEAASLETARAATGAPAAAGAGSADPVAGELRRAGVLPLLVLHLLGDGRSYGNRLIERIAEVSDGLLVVNPNTMYPLLRDLEKRKLIEGRWEHPDRRTRRFYSITDAGREEYERLQAELSPFLDSMIRTVTLIKREIYGDG